MDKRTKMALIRNRREFGTYTPEGMGYMDYGQSENPHGKDRSVSQGGSHEGARGSGSADRTHGYNRPQNSATGKSAPAGYTAESDEELSHEEAMAWVNGMKNADGSTGPHWPMEQAEQVMREQKIQCDELEFFVTLNMMYSDYCKVAKKLGVSTTEFYACMAKAFLEDKDAVSDKLSRYYEYIVKH